MDFSTIGSDYPITVAGREGEPRLVRVHGVPRIGLGVGVDARHHLPHLHIGGLDAGVERSPDRGALQVELGVGQGGVVGRAVADRHARVQADAPGAHVLAEPGLEPRVQLPSRVEGRAHRLDPRGEQALPQGLVVDRQGDELEGLEEKAINSGASKLYVEDLREQFLREFAFPTMQSGAIYEKQYLLGTSFADHITLPAAFVSLISTRTLNLLSAAIFCPLTDMVSVVR